MLIYIPGIYFVSITVGRVCLQRSLEGCRLFVGAWSKRESSDVFACS